MTDQNSSAKPSARGSCSGKLGEQIDPLHVSESVPIVTTVSLNLTHFMTYADIPIASSIVTNTDVGKAATGNGGRYDVPRSACKPARPKLTDHIFGEYEEVEFRYVLKEVLGDGKLGVVRRCVEKDSGVEWACKTIRKSQLVYRHDIEAVRNEVAAMMELSGHYVIVNLHDIMEDDVNVHLIMDLCKGGELYAAILKRKRYPEQDAARVMFSVLSAIHFMQSKGFVHRDLKPENVILVDCDSYTNVRVVDFGQAEQLRPGQKLRTCTGSAFYVSPEVLAGSYGLETDMWSAGVMLYALLCGCPPFWAKEKEEIFAKIQEGQFDIENGPWKHISATAKDIVRRMLTVDPQQRITPAQAKDHPWILLHCSPQAAPKKPQKAPQGPAQKAPVLPPPISIPPPRFHSSSSSSPVSVLNADFESSSCPSPAAAHLSPASAIALPPDSPGNSTPRGAMLSLFLPEGRRQPSWFRQNLFTLKLAGTTPPLSPRSPHQAPPDLVSRSPRFRLMKGLSREGQGAKI